MRRADRQPPRARPERHDPDGLLRATPDGGGRLTAYQREALGFGSKTIWPSTEAFNRSAILPTRLPATARAWAADEERLEATQDDADAAAKRFWQRSSWYRRASIRNESLAGQPVIDDLPTQGAVLTDEVIDAAAAGDLMARRRLEDERYAYFAEASIVFLDLPDAVFRGYEGDDGAARARRATDDTRPVRPPAPRDRPRSSRSRSTCRSASAATSTTSSAARSASSSSRGPRWVMPGPEYAGTVVFYEDFPYAWWSDFRTLGPARA